MKALEERRQRSAQQATGAAFGRDGQLGTDGFSAEDLNLPKGFEKFLRD